MAKNIQAALEGLQHPDWKVRARAADDLTEGGAQGLEALIGALRDDSQFVRMAASRALGRMGDSESRPRIGRHVERSRIHGASECDLVTG